VTASFDRKEIKQHLKGGDMNDRLRCEECSEAGATSKQEV